MTAFAYLSCLYFRGECCIIFDRVSVSFMNVQHHLFSLQLYKIWNNWSYIRALSVADAADNDEDGDYDYGNNGGVWLNPGITQATSQKYTYMPF